MRSSTSWETVLYYQAFTDRINILIFSVNIRIIRSGGTDCIFGFGLDSIFRYVCLVLSTRSVKNRHYKQNAYLYVFHIVSKLTRQYNFDTLQAGDFDCK